LSRISVVLLSLAMLLAGTPVMAEGNGDGPSNWAKAEVEEAIAIGLVPDRLQSNYQAPITRDEFAELLVQSIITMHNDQNKYDRDWSIESFLERITLDVKFEDTDADYVKMAFVLGSINGVSDTKFAPDRLITRQEAATMVMNTIHYSSGIVYDMEVKERYKDFDRVAEWAKPAVLTINTLGIMQGVGDQFDYGGHITREQAIATFLRVYNGPSYERLTIKGVAALDSDWINIHFTVGKDYVYVDYPDPDYWMDHYDAVGGLTEAWYIYKVTNDYENPTLAQVVAVYGFYPIMGEALYPVVAATKENKSITIDFGYMTYTTLTKDHVIEMRLKPVPGYMTTKAGYTYGFPKQAVEPKVIE